MMKKDLKKEILDSFEKIFEKTKDKQFNLTQNKEILVII
jgi:hypothetical protein